MCRAVAVGGGGGDFPNEGETVRRAEGRKQMKAEEERGGGA